MIKVLLAPTERELAGVLRNNAISSSLPEERGADVLMFTNYGSFGIQRKSVPHDFVASIEDGRMARETTLLTKSCQFRLLVCEGRFRYYPDGKLDMGPRVPTRYTYRHIRGMLFDIRYAKSVPIDYTDDVRDTADYILALAEFFSKEKHLGLYTRPSAKSPWGAPTSHDIELWLLQSFPGIGPSLADGIIQHFNGRVPLGWTCGLDELRAVRKLGPKRAGVLWDSLPHEEVVCEKDAFEELREGLA